MGFPRQEYWSGLPFPPRGGLPDPGIKPESSSLQVDSLPLGPQGSREEDGLLQKEHLRDRSSGRQREEETDEREGFWEAWGEES